MRVVLRHALALSAVIALFAQAPAQSASNQSPAPSKVQPAAPQGRPLQPYTAEFKTTTVQTLANGVTITRESTSIEARDSQGRILRSIQQTPLPGGQDFRSVHITDPVENTMVHWDSYVKKATVIRMPSPAQRNGCRAFRGASQARVTPVQPSVVMTNGMGAATGGMGMIMASTGPLVQHTPPERQDLGVETIQGVEAHGQRWTMTIPAGQMGNDKPLVSVNETWIARDFGLVARSVLDDPRTGKTTQELVSFTPGDPDPSLFQPPPDYEIVTQEAQETPCNQ